MSEPTENIYDIIEVGIGIKYGIETSIYFNSAFLVNIKIPSPFKHLLLILSHIDSNSNLVSHLNPSAIQKR